MDGDKRSPSKGFKSFLRGGRALPGKVKLTRAEIAGANASQDFSRMTSSMGVTNSTSQESDSTATDFEPRKAPENEGMHGMPSSGTNLQAYQQSGNLRSMSNTRQAKFKKLLDSKVVDLDALYELSWSGIPHDLRPICWQLLLGYLPPNRDRREQVLARKRQEYADQVKEHFEIGISERSEEENAALRQVSVDVPRTAPGVAFFHQEPVQKSLERILYLWGIRHPASGYVQGINDLVTPFLTVFLSEHFEGPMEFWSVESLSETTVTAVEADSYWCLSRLLEGIQDHYTHAQPGIQRMVFSFQELVRRIDEPILQHMETESLEFLQFSFRQVGQLPTFARGAIPSVVTSLGHIPCRGAAIERIPKICVGCFFAVMVSATGKYGLSGNGPLSATAPYKRLDRKGDRNDIVQSFYVAGYIQRCPEPSYSALTVGRYL